MKKILKNKKGITLVALVVTIIILLILAGISIATLTGSGLFEKARLAEQESEEAEKKEMDKLSNYEDEIIKYLIGERNNIDYSEYDDILKILYTNAGTFKLPSTIDELLSSETVLDWVLNSKKNVDYIIENPDIFMNKIVNSETAMTCIGKNEYAGYKVITNEKYRENILKSTYIDKFDKGSTQVPTLTDNTNVIYSTQYDDKDFAYSAFDKNVSTCWWEPSPTTGEEYIGYDFGENVVPYKIEMNSIYAYNIYRCKNFYIEGSKDDLNYINLTSNLIAEQTTEKQTFILNNFEICKFVRMNIIDHYSNSGDWSRGVSELQIYCRKVPKDI